MQTFHPAVEEPKVGDKVRFIDGPVTGVIEGFNADGAAVIYWGTKDEKRYTTIEVLGDPRSRIYLV